MIHVYTIIVHYVAIIIIVIEWVDNMNALDLANVHEIIRDLEDWRLYVESRAQRGFYGA